jgi:hypothetical protein
VHATLARRFVADQIELLSQLIRQGDYVVDAGAHVGAVTLPLAKIVGAQGKVRILAEPCAPVRVCVRVRACACRTDSLSTCAGIA